MNPGNGAGFAPGSALASRRAGERSVAAPVIARPGSSQPSVLNMTGPAPVPASTRVPAHARRRNPTLFIHSRIAARQVWLARPVTW
jgi:hypothetical protein